MNHNMTDFNHLIYGNNQGNNMMMSSSNQVPTTHIPMMNSHRYSLFQCTHPNAIYQQNPHQAPLAPTTTTTLSNNNMNPIYGGGSVIPQQQQQSMPARTPVSSMMTK